MIKPVITLAALLLAAPAFAQTPMTPSKPMAMPAPVAASSQSPATKAFEAAKDRMMTDMGQPFSGDVDHDFVAGMLPHHRGAIDMAQIELQYGRDATLKHLARQIIRDQQKEVAFMERWQKSHPAK